MLKMMVKKIFFNFTLTNFVYLKLCKCTCSPWYNKTHCFVRVKEIMTVAGNAILTNGNSFAINTIFIQVGLHRQTIYSTVSHFCIQLNCLCRNFFFIYQIFHYFACILKMHTFTKHGKILQTKKNATRTKQIFFLKYKKYK